MSGYFGSISAVAIGAGAILLLCPDDPGIKKYLNFLVSLCMVCTLLLPIKDTIGTLPSLIDRAKISAASAKSVEVTNEYLIYALKEEIALAVRQDVSNRFGIADSNVSCEIEYIPETNEARLISIEVIIHKGGKCAVSDVSRYIGEIYDCDVNVTEG